MFIQTVSFIPPEDATARDIMLAAMRIGFETTMNEKLASLKEKWEKEGASISTSYVEIPAIKITVEIKGASPALEEEIRWVLKQNP